MTWNDVLINKLEGIEKELKSALEGVAERTFAPETSSKETTPSVFLPSLIVTAPFEELKRVKSPSTEPSVSRIAFLSRSVLKR